MIHETSLFLRDVEAIIANDGKLYMLLFKRKITSHKNNPISNVYKISQKVWMQ